jgi:hypothetical protein
VWTWQGAADKGKTKKPRVQSTDSSDMDVEEVGFDGHRDVILEGQHPVDLGDYHSSGGSSSRAAARAGDTGVSV